MSEKKEFTLWRMMFPHLVLGLTCILVVLSILHSFNLEDNNTWIQALESHKHRMKTSKLIAVGNLAFALVAITVITGSTIAAEELGKMLLIEAFKDTTGAVAQSVIEDFHTSQMNQMDQLINYLRQAHEFSENNGGNVRIQAGSQSSQSWANNTYIQFLGSEMMTFNSPVVYFELAYPFGK